MERMRYLGSTPSSNDGSDALRSPARLSRSTVCTWQRDLGYKHEKRDEGFPPDEGREACVRKHQVDLAKASAKQREKMWHGIDIHGRKLWSREPLQDNAIVCPKPAKCNTKSIFRGGGGKGA